MWEEINVPQLSPEWFLARERLLVTGSDAAVIMGHGYIDTEELITRKLNKKKGETNFHMSRGIENEPKAREWYCKEYNVTTRETGIIIPTWNRSIGGSLDGLVGDDGMIEIKCPYHFPALNDHGVKSDHYDQIQFYLMITGRKWCDYIIYRGDVYVKRVFPDPEYIEEMKMCINRFINRLENEKRY